MKQQAKSFQVFSLAKLSPQHLKEVKHLAALCKRVDGFDPVFYWNTIENRRNPGIHEFLCYSLDSTLVGYLAIYHFEEQEVEVTLVVHPDYRAHNIQGRLFEKLKQAVAESPIDISRYVFTCNQENTLLKEFLKTESAHCAGVTRKLALTARHYEKLKIAYEIAGGELLPVVLTLAEKNHIPALAKLGARCFGVAMADYQYYLEQALSDPSKRIIVMRYQEKVIGKVHAHLDKRKAFLYDLCVDPAFQNQGLGGTLLCRALQMLFDEKMTQAIVDVSHDSTLTWYEKFKFKCTTTYEHWKLPVFVAPLKQREKNLDELLLNFQCSQVQDQLAQVVSRH